MIRVVAPNPALDRIQVVQTFRPREVNRAHEVISLAGGKGMIVARGIRRLGGDVAVHGFAGGPIGEVIRAGCRELGVVDRHTPIAGDTRVTAVVVEADGGASTVVNEPGPLVGPAEQAAFLEGLAADVAPGDLVVVTGSLPRGTGTDLHARVLDLAHSAGATTMLDTHGPPLRVAVDRRPGLAKPNLSELSELLGAPLDPGDRAVLLAHLRRLCERGVGAVLVTLGAAGVLYADAEVTLAVAAPAVRTRNATGSGDMLLAGFALATARGAAPADALRLGVAAGAANAANLAPDVDADAVHALVAAVEVTELDGDAVAAAG